MHRPDHLLAMAALGAVLALAGCSGDGDLVGSWTDTRTGRLLPDGSPRANGLLVVNTVQASNDCSGDDTVFLMLAWPVGTPVDGDDETRVHTYLRDTRGSLLPTDGTSDLDASLPAEARSTGFEREGNVIHVVDHGERIYLVRPDGGAERWARLIPGTRCTD